MFFVIAIFAPFISYLVDRISNTKMLMGCLAILVLSELLFDESCNFTTKLIFIQIPYFVVFAMGYVIRRLERKNVLIMSVISATLFLSYATLLFVKTDTFVPTGLYKYPPQIYYLSYAVTIILLLWMYREPLYKVTKRISIDKVLCFMGSHSLWVYFWHIVVLLVIEHSNIHFLIKYLVVVSISLLVTYIQSLIVSKMQPYIKSETLRKNIKIVLDC